MATNNEEFRQIIKANNLRIAEILAAFKAGGADVSRAKANAFLVNANNRRYQHMPPELLEAFKKGVVTINERP